MPTTAELSLPVEIQTTAKVAPVVIHDNELDHQDRLKGTLAGEWGSSIAHTTHEQKFASDKPKRIGFAPPLQRIIDIQIDEILKKHLNQSGDLLPNTPLEL